MDALLPWPSRRERRAAIAAARAQKAASRRAAAHADNVRAAIDRMIADNHFAQRIANQIIARHGGDTR